MSQTRCLALVGRGFQHLQQNAKFKLYARSTRAYRLWSELYRAVEGDEHSLLRALQEKGFVKWRKG